MRLALLSALLLAAATPRSGCGPGEPAADTALRSTAHPDCAGKGCGAACNPCLPERVCPTLVATACDAQGACVSAPQVACDPCAGKACGETCQPCPPGLPCPLPIAASACDRQGRCVTAQPALCWDPCAGKRCGDPCRICPPGASDCVETAELKACDAQGRCTSRTPDLACPAP